MRSLLSLPALPCGNRADGKPAGPSTWVGALAFALAWGIVGVAFAQERGGQKQGGNEKNESTVAAEAKANVNANVKANGVPAKRGKQNADLVPMAITPEREAAVMTFVERNHAELGELLNHLKAHQPKEYERAVRELFRVTERLATIQERDTTQYELEIDLWTAQSQVQLLAARMTMGVTDELREQLRQALGAQADARLALLKHERERVKNRLARIDEEISQFEANRERTMERQMRMLTRRGAGGGPKNKQRQKKP